MKKIVVFVVAVVAVCAWAAYRFWAIPDTVTAQSAVVESRVAVAGVAVSGVVKNVYVDAGERVAREQPLLALDAAGFESQLARERSILAGLAAALPPNTRVSVPGVPPPVSTGKPLATLRAEEEDARRRVETAAHAYAAANVAYSRQNARAPSGYSGQETARQAALIARDEAARALQTAKDAFEKAGYARARKEAEEKADAAGQRIPAALAARIAEYQAQASRVRLAEEALAGTVLLAPESGVVRSVAVRPGDMVAPGDAPVTIVPDDRGPLWVTAFFAEKDGGAIAVGQECRISLEGEAASFAGTVADVTPMLMGESAEKRLVVRIVMGQNNLPESLAPGRTVSAVVRTGAKPFWPGIARKLTTR